MASIIYDTAKERMGIGTFAPVTQDVRILLLDGTTTTPDDPTKNFVSDIVADEVTDASYSRQTLAGKTGTKNVVNHRWEFSFTSPVFTSLSNGTTSIKFAILYEFITNDAASPLIGAADIADTVPDGTDFKLIVGSTGALHIT